MSENSENSKDKQNYQNITNTEKDEEKQHVEPKQSSGSIKTINYVTYKSAPCPLPNCSHIVIESNLLSHFVAEHYTNWGLKISDIYSDTSFFMPFKPTALNRRQTECLVLLAYGGPSKELGSEPMKSEGAMSNIFLPKSYDKWQNHYVVLMMLCRTTWAALLKGKEGEMKLTQEDNPDQDVFVLWVTGLQTVRPIYATMTLVDKKMSVSNSKIVKVRSLNDSQDPHEFCRKDLNFLRLDRSEVNLLSKNGNDPIYLQVIINEYDK